MIIYNIIVKVSIMSSISIIFTLILTFYYLKSKNKNIVYEILIIFFYFLSFYENIVIFRDSRRKRLANENKLVSIIMPMYNRDKVMHKSIESPVVYRDREKGGYE